MSAPLKTHWCYPRHLHSTGKYNKERHAFLECQLQTRLATKGYLKWHRTPPYSQLSLIPIQLSQSNSLERLEAAHTPLLPQPAALLPVKHWWEKLLLNKWDDWPLGNHLMVGDGPRRQLMLTVALEKGNSRRDEWGPPIHTSVWERRTPETGFQHVKSTGAQELAKGWKITLFV